ncbi:sister chromatid cohesion protein PDS5 homolog B [Trichonephila clavipes]|nr:sister chromatid cohesion protein PDS5 homolog B [Trichonephila clavipes]
MLRSSISDSQADAPMLRSSVIQLISGRMLLYQSTFISSLDSIKFNKSSKTSSQRTVASSLAKEIFLKTATTIEPYIQAFYNNAFILGASVHSSLSPHLYQLIYEINCLNPGVLLTVIPQLEFKLKSTDTTERAEVTEIVGQMFSDKNSNMIETHKLLWECFLDRFNDINKDIRLLCVSFVRECLVHHPNSRQDITAKLKHRHRDTEPDIRTAVVKAVADAAREDLFCVNEDLMNYMKERTLDKMVGIMKLYPVRKAAVLGLGRLHKHYLLDSVCPDPRAEAMLSFVKNKLLNVYYQPIIKDSKYAKLDNILISVNSSSCASASSSNARELDEQILEVKINPQEKTQFRTLQLIKDTLSKEKESENENEETKLIRNDFAHYVVTSIDADLREQILKLGPYQPEGNFQKDAKRRSFSSSYYSFISKAGQKIERKWLCYSTRLHVAYCQVCWLFADRTNMYFKEAWCKGGNDWQGI